MRLRLAVLVGAAWLCGGTYDGHGEAGPDEGGPPPPPLEPGGTYDQYQPPTTENDGEVTCIDGQCMSNTPDPRVISISPSGGSISGGTKIVIFGQGFREFGPLMRCRFGDPATGEPDETQASLTVVDKHGYINPYNHTHMACASPASRIDAENTVAFEVSLNGQDFTSDGRVWHYQANPEIVALSPSRGSASTSQLITVTRNDNFLASAWAANRPAVCRFESIVDPDGKMQVPFKQDVGGTIVDSTELQCPTPTVNFVAPVTVEVSLNGGQDFTSSGLTFTYDDSWHAPPLTGQPPSSREGAASALVGDDLYIFGGSDLNFDQDGAPGPTRHDARARRRRRSAARPRGAHAARPRHRVHKRFPRAAHRYREGVLSVGAPTRPHVGDAHARHLG